MKMLEVPEYSLLEIHEFEERTLRLNEKPLLVQLNWHNDDKDGRYPHTFLLVPQIDPSVPQPVFTITEKAPTRAFSWLKAPTSAFTFKTL